MSSSDAGIKPPAKPRRSAAKAPPSAPPVQLDPAVVEALIAGRYADPFAILGPHVGPAGRIVRTLQPGASAVQVLDRKTGQVIADLTPEGGEGFFSGVASGSAPYRLRIEWPLGVQETEDPYSFGLVLGDLDLHLFSQGAHWKLSERLGAAPVTFEGVDGVRFAVWAPNARRVSVVGSFNSWDGRRHPMRLRAEAGVWELFIPRLAAGEIYKYEIVGPGGETLPLKADPLARRTEHPPATGSVVAALPDFQWTDEAWLTARGARQAPDAAMSIYEVQASSWMRPEGDPSGILNWAGLERLIDYAAGLGFTHIELMPIMEHPFGGSWGYQPLSQFAPSARYGRPEDLARFIDVCHAKGLGVILDWVPAHFPTDVHGLAQFDGTHLYEHADPTEGFHQDWNTLIFNLGRTEVQGFLIASALFWLETFHIDGLRVDAVASMLYRDYSRKAGQWHPNIYGGRENLEAIAFIKRLNEVVHERCPGAVTIAEESTAWPGVSKPVAEGGLGFDYKWNMGWMHDTLTYFGKDPIHRAYQHHDMTFGMVYAFSEKFVLPLSHDEVVHGTGSLYQRAPGDAWQKLANLRAYFSFMWTHPGKKLLFMGGELGQRHEWNHDGQLDWGLLNDPGHAGLQRIVGDLNRLYAAEPALHEGDCEPWGFEWVIGDAAAISAFAYLRRAKSGESVLVLLNMTPVVRHDFRIGVPEQGFWTELLNSDAGVYGGSDVGNAGGVEAEQVPAHGRDWSLNLTLPPLAALVLKRREQ